jgi:hypothetical protein
MKMKFATVFSLLALLTATVTAPNVSTAATPTYPDELLTTPVRRK